MPAPTRNHRLQAVFLVRGEVEKSGAKRRQQPLVQVGAIEVAADTLQVERNHARSMGAVDDRQDSMPPRRGANLFDGQYCSGGVADVADKEQPRFRLECGGNRIENLARL